MRLMEGNMGRALHHKVKMLEIVGLLNLRNSGVELPKLHQGQACRSSPCPGEAAGKNSAAVRVFGRIGHLNVVGNGIRSTTGCRAGRAGSGLPARYAKRSGAAPHESGPGMRGTVETKDATTSISAVDARGRRRVSKSRIALS